MPSVLVFAQPGHFTPLPNALFDGVQPHLSLSAWSVLCVILRRTRGWNKSSDAISYAQIKTATGIKSDTTVAKALAELLCDALFGTAILRRDTGTGANSGGEATRYELNPNFALDLPLRPSPENEDPTTPSSPKFEVALHSSTPENEDTKEREFHSSLALCENQTHSSASTSSPTPQQEPPSDSTENSSSLDGWQRSTPSLAAISHRSIHPNQSTSLTQSTSSTNACKFAQSEAPPNQTPLFLAVCAATQRDPDLVSARMRAQLADCTDRLARAGYDASQVELAAKRWPLSTAPYPSQLLDNIQSLLAARPLSPSNASPSDHVPHPVNSARRIVPPRERAGTRKARKWEQWLDELA